MRLDIHKTVDLLSFDLQQVKIKIKMEDLVCDEPAVCLLVFVI